MAKYAAKGAIIEIGDTDGGASVTWTPIAQFRSISTSGGEAERIDATTHDSTGGYREFVAGFKGETSFSFEIMYDPADTSHDLLVTLYGTGETRDVRITVPSSPTANITFEAFVTNFPLPQLPVDDMMTVEVSMTVAGAITFP